MKSQSGFVSNSSSSSFIVAKPKDVKTVEVTFTIDLELLGDKITSLTDWKELTDDLSYYEQEDMYERGKQILENGGEIISCNFSNESGETLSELFYDKPEMLIDAVVEKGLFILLDET